MKKLISNLFKLLGYDLRRIHKSFDLELYDFPKDSIINRRFYNIGAGRFRHPYWTNIDHFSEHYKKNEIDIEYDLLACKPLPIPDNSAELIYTSHVLEHITNKAVRNILKESYRILKPGGIIRIVVPDTELDYQAYLRGDRDHFQYPHYWTEKTKGICINGRMRDTSIEQMFLYNIASNVSTIHADGADKRLTDEKFNKLFNDWAMRRACDYCIKMCSLKKQKKYPYNHINWFYERKLNKMLCEAGFFKIFRSGYQQSLSPIMRNTRFFDTSLHKVSLYMEAVK